MKRDFTYIEDIVEGVVRVLAHIPAGTIPNNLYNIGHHRPVSLLYFIEILEQCLGKTALKQWLPMQPGDVPETYADIDDLVRDVGFRPATPLETGIPRFIEWYRKYYSL